MTIRLMLVSNEISINLKYIIMSEASNALKEKYRNNLEDMEQHELNIYRAKSDINQAERNIKLRKSWIQDLVKANQEIEEALTTLDGFFDVNNLATDLWGGAGPDCLNVQLAAAFSMTTFLLNKLYRYESNRF